MLNSMMIKMGKKFVYSVVAGATMLFVAFAYPILACAEEIDVTEQQMFDECEEQGLQGDMQEGEELESQGELQEGEEQGLQESDTQRFWEEVEAERQKFKEELGGGENPAEKGLAEDDSTEMDPAEEKQPEGDENGTDDNNGTFPEIGGMRGEEIVQGGDDPCGRVAHWEELPQYPNEVVSSEDVFEYYRMNGKEVGIYDLQPGRVYYMHYLPLPGEVLAQTDNFVVINKVWEQQRGGVIGLFGDFTKRTIQYTDITTGEVCYNRALSSGLSFYEIEKIDKVTDPSINNQFF